MMYSTEVGGVDFTNYFFKERGSHKVIYWFNPNHIVCDGEIIHKFRQKYPAKRALNKKYLRSLIKKLVKKYGDRLCENI